MAPLDMLVFKWRVERHYIVDYLNQSLFKGIFVVRLMHSMELETPPSGVLKTICSLVEYIVKVVCVWYMIGASCP